MKLRCVFMTAILCAVSVLLQNNNAMVKKGLIKGVYIGYGERSIGQAHSVIIKHKNNRSFVPFGQEVYIPVNNDSKDPGELLILHGNSLYCFKYPKAYGTMMGMDIARIEIGYLDEYIAGTKSLPLDCSMVLVSTKDYAISDDCIEA